MKGLQSYNFRDSPDFREAKKVEKRVKSRDDRNRERLDEKAAVYKQEALQAIEMIKSEKPENDEADADFRSPDKRF